MRLSGLSQPTHSESTSAIIYLMCAMEALDAIEAMDVMRATERSERTAVLQSQEEGEVEVVDEVAAALEGDALRR